MGRKLYEWQEKCLERWQESGGRGMVQAVTGSGKTLFALTAADRLDRRLNGELLVRIVVPTEALLRQWNRDLREYFQGNPHGGIGLRYGGHKAPHDCKYMIYVINSARYELARRILAELQSGAAVLLIADECHHYESGQNRLIFEFLPHIEPWGDRFFSLGLSATLPSGQAGRYLSSVLGRRIYSYGMAEASKLQTVCRYDIFHIGLSFQYGEKDEYDEISDRMYRLYGMLLQAHPILDRLDQKERYELLRRLAGDKNRKLAEAASSYMALSYKRRSLVCLAAARVGCARELVGRLDSEDRILVFGERIRQAEELYQGLRWRYPGRVGCYHSKMGREANRNVLERFRSGELRILIACKAIDEGIDIPDASVGIILSGTGAQRQRIQRLGRIIRKKEGKGRASLYYLHIAESSEDSCFLPDEGETRIFEMEYDLDTGMISHPLYDRAAEAALEKMRREGRAEEIIQEAGRCLALGCTRSDWTLGREEIDDRIKKAKSTREKNYWICMKRLASVPGGR